jgi:hypothetical protein
MDAFEPLAMSIFYAAVNSMKDTDVVTMFGTDKSYLLNRYRTGTEAHLKRQKFMTSRIFEVLQAFVVFLVCFGEQETTFVSIELSNHTPKTALYREDDMGKAWPLTGLAIRMATVQGLHRDPLALPLGTIDVVQVELRRRLWAQICYLDFRTAEDHGLAPSIHESDFDTCRYDHLSPADHRNPVLRTHHSVDACFAKAIARQRSCGRGRKINGATGPVEYCRDSCQRV